MGVASLAMLAACSDDAPVVDGGNTGVVPGDGTTAYMSVVLSAPGDFGRSTDFEDGDDKTDALKPGDEHAIKNAKFFFFDENGNFVLNAKLMTPDFGESTQKPNIEWESKSNVLVLEDMTANNYPSYMLTVLNMDDFEAESTLQATAEKLVSSAYTLNDGKYDNFVMSTSSYDRGADQLTASKYAVNKLETKNFATTPDLALATGTPVEVYVERLAAKVELAVNATSTTYTENGVEHTIYKLNQTVAGEGNDNNEPINGDQTANTEIYLEVLGWSLNATATQSHMSKQLKDEWFTTAPFAAWENARYFRSYWAYSYPYTLGTDCESTLNYVKYTEINADGLSPKLGSDYPQYCMENTNAPANILDFASGLNTTTKKYGVYNSRVTHAVLNTRLCDKNGKSISALNMRGVLFTEAALKSYALNALKNAGKLNYYIYTGSASNEDKTEIKNYRGVDVNDIKFVGIEGSIGGAKFAYAGEQLYKKVVEEDGATKMVETDSEQLVVDLNALADARDIEWYNTRNIYYIPVEHNASNSATDNSAEGYYGVVRNHWYKIEINSFSKVGHGVYDPDDTTIEIKPGKPDDPLYYLGARINVLSWRVINQSVDL